MILVKTFGSCPINQEENIGDRLMFRRYYPVESSEKVDPWVEQILEEHVQEAIRDIKKETMEKALINQEPVIHLSDIEDHS